MFKNILPYLPGINEYNYLLFITNMISITNIHWVLIILILLDYVLTIDKASHDDVIKWKHFPRYWPFVRGIPRSPVNSPHKGQRRGALMFSLICVWINGWENNREAGDLRRYRAHFDVIVMAEIYFHSCHWCANEWHGAHRFAVYCYVLVPVRILYTHYNDVIMSAMASQMTVVSIVCSTI